MAIGFPGTNIPGTGCSWTRYLRFRMRHRSRRGSSPTGIAVMQAYFAFYRNARFVVPLQVGLRERLSVDISRTDLGRRSVSQPAVVCAIMPQRACLRWHARQSHLITKPKCFSYSGGTSMLTLQC
jgi:hypothetical protein